MYFLTEEELKELKIQIDLTAKWFLDLMQGDIEFNGSINDLIDSIVPFVQMKLQYCTSIGGVEREKLGNVSRLQGRLNSDFFLATQRILTNCSKSVNPMLEIQGEFTYYDYYFQYSSKGFFYYVDDSQVPRLVTEASLINMVATLGDWHSPFFETFFQSFRMDVNEKSTPPLQDNPNYQMLLKIYLHKWLREQIALRLPKPTDRKGKLGVTKKQLSTFKEMLKDQNDFKIVREALKKCDCLNDDQIFNDALGNKIKVVSLFDVLGKKSYLVNEAIALSGEKKAQLFNNQFNCSITGRQIREEPNEYSDHYKKLWGAIPTKNTVTRPYSPPK